MKTKCIPAVVMIAVMATATAPRAQQVQGAAIWREFAATLQPGASIAVRLTSGQRVKATLLQVSDEAITIQLKTRVPVAPHQVAYADIESLELQRANGGGVGIGKAVAIGAAVGAGAFLGLLMIALASWAD